MQPGGQALQQEDNGINRVPESNDPYFEPIIPLPALVEVKVDEDEAVIFSHRAKLYRFESSTKEWKEKGVGDIKILHNKDNNTYRILLRRYCAPNLQIKTSLIYFYTFKGSNSQIGVQSLAYWGNETETNVHFDYFLDVVRYGFFPRWINLGDVCRTLQNRRTSSSL